MRKLFKTLIILTSLLTLTVPLGAEPIIIDHTCTDLSKIPDNWLEEAKELAVHYGHTSHGSQIMAGLSYLEENVDSQKYSYACANRNSSRTPVLPPEESTPALRMWEEGLWPDTAGGHLGYWLGEEAKQGTLDVLASGMFDVSGWAWCGQVSDNHDASYFQEYFDTLDDFQTQNPGVTVFYMTGHNIEPGPPNYQQVAFDRTKSNNDAIRQYCIDNDKVLFDFADIENYDPDGNYYPNEDGTCVWCEDWCRDHPEDCQNLPPREEVGGGCGIDFSAHAHGLFAVQKAKAFWWMMARLAGWNPEATGCTQDSDCTDDNVCNGIETCQAGTCVSGQQLVCDDGNPCTNNICDPLYGCEYQAVPNGTACDDGQFCNGEDICVSGQCQTGTQPCSDGCDEANDRCLDDPDNSSCDDSNECTDDYSVNGECTHECSALDADDPCCLDDVCAGSPICRDDSSLSAYYPLDSSADDVSGQGRDGIVRGNAEFGSDHFGNPLGALNLDGNNDYVDLGTGRFDLTNELTIALWAKIDGSTGSYQALIQKGAYAHPYVIKLNGTRIQVCLRTQAGTNYLSSNSRIDYGQWVHVALTYGNGFKIIYINGQEDSRRSLNGSLYVTADTVTTIGRNPNQSRPDYTRGAVDEVRIYNRLLSAQEISALYSNVEPPQDTEPPAVPDNLQAEAVSPTEVNLSWTVSEDNIAVAGYKVFRDGLEVAETATNSYADTGLEPAAEYAYTVTAFDAAGNESDQSDSAFVETPEMPVAVYSLVLQSSYGTVIIDPDLEAYEEGTVVELTAVPEDGYEFTGWSGDASGTNNPISIVMDSDKTIRAEYTQSVPEWSNLQGYWRFDEGYGQSAADDSGYDRTGYLINGTRWADGMVSGAIDLDGINDYVDLGTDGFGLSNGLTISMWVRISGSTGNTQTLIQKGAYAYPFMIRLYRNRIQTCLRTSRGTDYLNSNETIEYGSWFHVAMTYANGLRVLYINGREDRRDSVNGNLYIRTNSQTTIGRSPNNRRPYYTNGSVDDVRIFNRALTAQEIQVIYGE